MRPSGTIGRSNSITICRGAGTFCPAGGVRVLRSGSQDCAAAVPEKPVAAIDTSAITVANAVEHPPFHRPARMPFEERRRRSAVDAVLIVPPGPLPELTQARLL